MEYSTDRSGMYRMINKKTFEFNMVLGNFNVVKYIYTSKLFHYNRPIKGIQLRLLTD